MTEDKFSVPCNICGGDIKDGDAAYGTTTGTIDVTVEGFFPSDNTEYLTIACKKCGQIISDRISKIGTPTEVKEIDFAEEALCAALGEFTCNSNELMSERGFTAEEVLEALREDKYWKDDAEFGDSYIVVRWEPFDHHDGKDVAKMVEDAAYSIEEDYKRIAKMAREGYAKV